MQNAATSKEHSNKSHFMEKERLYKKLVAKRKECEDCLKMGMSNPSSKKFDCYEINAWSQWQNSLSAKILLVGQDWGDSDYFKINQGTDRQRKQDPTNSNLVRLFGKLGYELDAPCDHAYGRHCEDLFFTNLVLCLKPESQKNRSKTNLSGKLPKGVAKCCSKFTRELIEIIQPKVVVALGGTAFKSVAYAFGLKVAESRSLEDCMEKSPYKVKELNVAIFPVFHCGYYGSLSRKIESQEEDWSKIKLYLDNA